MILLGRAEHGLGSVKWYKLPPDNNVYLQHCYICLVYNQTYCNKSRWIFLAISHSVILPKYLWYAVNCQICANLCKFVKIQAKMCRLQLRSQLTVNLCLQSTIEVKQPSRLQFERSVEGEESSLKMYSCAVILIWRFHRWFQAHVFGRQYPPYQISL